jgi:peptidoglycan/xylan/chitin deacetylase (PgdA/CDA1 family)
MPQGGADRLKALLRRPVARTDGAVQRLSRRAAGLAVLFHRVGDPQQTWDDGKYPRLSPRFFEAQLRHLIERYRVVPASELIEAARRRRRGEPFPVAVTFDDDSPSHVTDAAPILQRFGVPATFFVSGASLDGPRSFWWQRLDRAMERGAIGREELSEMVPAAGGVPPGLREMVQIADDIELMTPEQLRDLESELGRRAGPDPEDAVLDASGLRKLVAAGFEIGFHTLRHLNLSTLDSAELGLAMGEGRDRLAEAIDRELTLIAYPGGKWNPHVLEAARGAGFLRGFTTEPRAVLPDSNPLCLGRVDSGWCTTLGQVELSLTRALRRDDGVRLGQATAA